MDAPSRLAFSAAMARWAPISSTLPASSKVGESHEVGKPYTHRVGRANFIQAIITLPRRCGRSNDSPALIPTVVVLRFCQHASSKKYAERYDLLLLSLLDR